MVGLSARLAELLGRPAQVVNAIVNRKKAVTPETAVDPLAAFGTSLEFWLNLETTYCLANIDPADPAIAQCTRQRNKPARFST